MKNRRIILQIMILAILLLCMTTTVYAEPGVSISKDGINIGTAQNPQDVASSVQILLLLTVLALAPSILIMLTSFTRIIIVLSFLRNALGTQQMPPNQVMIGLALFLTFFIMAPVGTQINNEVFQPFTKGEITQQVALDTPSQFVKGWMLKQIPREKDLELFASLANIKAPVKKQELPMTVVIPAFIISELKTAFQMGFLIFLPFLVIDMVVSSTLMSMGMMMLPPVMISLPFKLLLFVMVDGWNLVTQTIVKSFVP
jgi:flagellar biosynthesis protein FliP